MTLRAALLPALVLSALLTTLQACDKEPLSVTKPGPDLAVHLSNPVEVARDANGVAHIYARGWGDLLYAQGYETARDRLFHMEYWRRYTYGTRSELWGAKHLDDDIAKRAIGFSRAAQANWLWYQQHHPRVAKLVQSYSNGVNAALRDMQAGKNGLKRPKDLDLVAPGFWPQPWSPVDSIALGRALMFSQNFGGDTELVIFASKFLMGPEKFSDIVRWQPLFPTYILEDHPLPKPGQRSGGLSAPSAAQVPAAPSEHRLDIAATLRIPAGKREAVAAALRQVAAALARAAGRQEPGDSSGSNSWVVAGQHVQGGGAILCNDPHMSMEIPSRLYPMHLVEMEQGELGAYGYSLPGTPFLTFGATPRLGWAITNSYVDATDLYNETLCDDGKGTMLAGKCVPMERREEVIRVRKTGAGVDQFTEEKRTLRWVPHHGPVLNDLVPGQVGQALDGVGIVLSARWTGLSTETQEAAALLALLEAKDIGAGKQALALMNGGVMNWSLADSKGDIAYRAAGAWPKRAKSAKEQPPWDPLPGTGEAEWTGTLPDNQVPQITNPQKGFVVTANNQQGPQANDNDLSNDPQYYANFQDVGSRAFRITQLLDQALAKGPLALQQAASIQLDDRAVLADVLLPSLLAQEATLCAAPGDSCDAVRALAKWDRGQGVDSQGAALYGAWFNHLVRNSVGDDIPSLIMPLLRGFLGVIGAKAAGAWLRPEFASPTWWDQEKTPQIEDAGDIVRGSLDDALVQLRAFYGQKPMAQWQWGDLHLVLFKHVAHPDALSVGPLPRAGGDRTVNAADYPCVDAAGNEAPLPWLMTEGAVFRFCVQLSATPVALQALAGGTSADSAAPHYKDQADHWIAGKHVAVPWTRSDVKTATTEKWTLAAGL